MIVQFSEYFGYEWLSDGSLKEFFRLKLDCRKFRANSLESGYSEQIHGKLVFQSEFIGNCHVSS